VQRVIRGRDIQLWGSQDNLFVLASQQEEAAAWRLKRPWKASCRSATRTTKSFGLPSRLDIWLPLLKSNALFLKTEKTPVFFATREWCWFGVSAPLNDSIVAIIQKPGVIVETWINANRFDGDGGLGQRCLRNPSDPVRSTLLLERSKRLAMIVKSAIKAKMGLWGCPPGFSGLQPSRLL